MPETSEFKERPFPPLDQRRFEIAQELSREIALKVGTYIGMTPSGVPVVQLDDKYECVVPTTTQLFEFVSVEVLDVRDDEYHLLVSGFLPEHPSLYTQCQARAIPVVHCVIRVAPPRSISPETQKHPPTIVATIATLTAMTIATLIAPYVDISGTVNNMRRTYEHAVRWIETGNITQPIPHPHSQRSPR
jgi:hypothetical protein